MPIRVHVSQLSNEALLKKLGIKQRAKPRQLERPHQMALIKWVRSVMDTYPVLKLLYAVPNGGNRNLSVARKLKAEGVRAGVADLCLPASRRGYHGLYLEMKSEEGSATKEQKEFLRGVSEEGYCAVIAHWMEEARAVLEWYLGITENEPISVSKTSELCQPQESRRKRDRSSSELRLPKRSRATFTGISHPQPIPQIHARTLCRNGISGRSQFDEPCQDPTYDRD